MINQDDVLRAQPINMANDRATIFKAAILLLMLESFNFINDIGKKITTHADKLIVAIGDLAKIDLKTGSLNFFEQSVTGESEVKNKHHDGPEKEI